MVFEPQQYSAFEIVNRILQDGRFCFYWGNEFNQPFFSYSLRKGKIKLPDGEVALVYALVDIGGIRRKPLNRNGKQPLDEIVINELRDILGGEASRSFCDDEENQFDILMRYDYLDESSVPNLPGRIRVRVIKKSWLEQYGTGKIAHPLLAEISFLREQRRQAFYNFRKLIRIRYPNLVLPTADSAV